MLGAVTRPKDLRCAGSEGQSLLEYTLILALICIGAICSMIAVGQGIVQVFTIIYKALAR
ncbi:MAG: hypothetical protein KatS3mg059_1164 [Thermomicrobiales bacterium]|nr:MAG: hypothetical protein KatS3mg059_1164 [Thermomicrobiales bacterium]